MSQPPVPVVNPPAELTDDNVAGFEAELVEIMRAAGPGIVVDLDGVSFISSSGLGCLVKIGMRLDGRGRRIALARPDRDVERSLRLIGLHSMLPVFASVDLATTHVVASA